MKQLLAFSILFCTLHSVQARSPLGALPKGQMVGILVDLELAKAMAYDYNNDEEESADQLFQGNAQLIYQAHDTEPATFQESYLYYLAYPKLMQEIYELVIARLEELLAQVQ